MKAKGYTFCGGADERDILRYGEYLTDKQYATWDNHRYHLRVIFYEGKLYWHKMVDGELIEFKVIDYRG